MHYSHMLTTGQTDELVDHLCRQSPLTPTEAQRLVEEVLAYYSESSQSFIRRRHFELQKSGLANSSIYRLIGVELKRHRFTAEPLTERQIRRAIYG